MAQVKVCFGIALALGASLLVLPSCTTAAAKKAMGKPAPTDSYSGFDPESSKDSKRTAERFKPVSADTAPEVAVNRLVDKLKGEKGYSVQAEEQLRAWGSRQGVGPIIVSEVRPLLHDPRVEVRAPALRLTIQFGGDDSTGDLIEALADPEYGIRDTAFRALKSRAKRDFGYNPASGELARADSTDEWRRWYQSRQSAAAAQPPSVYEKTPQSGPTYVAPRPRVVQQ